MGGWVGGWVGGWIAVPVPVLVPVSKLESVGLPFRAVPCYAVLCYVNKLA